MKGKIRNFDAGLWCEDCGESYATKCNTHAPYFHIKDKAIPSRARLTAPHPVHIKQLQMTVDVSHVYGVFAKKVIQKRIQFGPYEGQQTETWNHDRNDRIRLKLCYGNQESVFLDCTDENICNWMMFIRPAENISQQNLVAFQYNDKIYFVTTRAIGTNEELRVWYAKGYEQMLKKCNGDISKREGSPVPTPPDSENEIFTNSYAIEEVMKPKSVAKCRKKRGTKKKAQAILDQMDKFEEKQKSDTVNRPVLRSSGSGSSLAMAIERLKKDNDLLEMEMAKRKRETAALKTPKAIEIGNTNAEVLKSADANTSNQSPNKGKSSPNTRSKTKVVDNDKTGSLPVDPTMESMMSAATVTTQKNVVSSNSSIADTSFSTEVINISSDIQLQHPASSQILPNDIISSNVDFSPDENELHTFDSIEDSPSETPVIETMESSVSVDISHVGETQLEVLTPLEIAPTGEPCSVIHTQPDDTTDSTFTTINPTIIDISLRNRTNTKRSLRNKSSTPTPEPGEQVYKQEEISSAAKNETIRPTRKRQNGRSEQANKEAAPKKVLRKSSDCGENDAKKGKSTKNSTSKDNKEIVSTRTTRSKKDGHVDMPNLPIECVICHVHFGTESALDKHSKIHTGDLPYVCDVVGCGKRFVSSFKLKRHKTSHGTGLKFECAYCDKKFGRKDHLKSHLNVHNPQKETFECEDCGKRYHALYAYKCHVAQHKIAQGDLTCFVCNANFPAKDDIEYHLKVHSGSRLVKTPSQKRHSCPHCEMKFFTKSDMRRHQVTHNKLRPFMCHLCPQAFGRQDHLTRHMRTAHSEDKNKAVGTENPAERNAKIPQLTKKSKKKSFGKKGSKNKGKAMKKDKGGKESDQHEENLMEKIEIDTKLVVMNRSNLTTNTAVMTSNAPSSGSYETVRTPSGNFTVLQNTPTLQLQGDGDREANLNSQKTMQITNMLASNSELSLFQSSSFANIESIDSLLRYIGNTEAEAAKVSTTGDQNKADQSAKPKKANVKGKGKTVTRKGAKRRGSSSRSPLTSQPTISVDLLPGVSHLGSPEAQKPKTAPVTSQNDYNISYIEKLNLTELFGEKVKNMQKHEYLKLMKDLQSVATKNAPASTSPGISSEKQVTQQGAVQGASNIIALNVPHSVKTNMTVRTNQTPTIQMVTPHQPPALTNIDTQTIIQQLLNGPDPIQFSQSGNAATIGGVPMPQNVHLVQVFDTSLAQNQNVHQVPTVSVQEAQVQNIPTQNVVIGKMNEQGEIVPAQQPVNVQENTVDAQANQQTNPPTIIQLPEDWVLLTNEGH